MDALQQGPRPDGRAADVVAIVPRRPAGMAEPPRPVWVVKPPKNVSEITDAELDEWAQETYDAFAARENRPIEDA